MNDGVTSSACHLANRWMTWSDLESDTGKIWRDHTRLRLRDLRGDSHLKHMQPAPFDGLRTNASMPFVCGFSARSAEKPHTNNIRYRGSRAASRPRPERVEGGCRRLQTADCVSPDYFLLCRATTPYTG